MEATKMRFVITSSIIALLFLVRSSLAISYFVSKSGNDNNDGISWASAWNSIDQANNTISVGDTVFFGTGEWFDSQIVPPAGGVYSARTVYSCSTMSSASWHMAIINGGDSVKNWIPHSGYIYKARWTGNACLSSGKSYTLTQNDILLTPISTLTGIDEPGEFYHDLAKDTIYAWLINNSDPNNQEMVTSCKPPVEISSESQDHILFYGLDFRMGKQGTILFGLGGDSVFFEHCNLSRAGHAAMENAAVVMSKISFGSWWGEYNTFIACSLGYAVAENPNVDHMGDGAILYGQRYMRFDSCWFYSPFGNGVFFKNDLSSYESSTGNVIRYCTFDGMNQLGVFKNIGNVGIRIGYNFENHGNDFIGNNTLYRCNIFMLLANPIPDNMSQIMYNVGYDIEYQEGLDNYFIGFPYTDGVELMYLIDYNSWYDPETAFLCECQSNWSNWPHWGNICDFDVHGNNSNPGLADPENGDFSRPNSMQEIDIFYGGKHWTLFGAWQPPGETDVNGEDSTDENTAVLDIHTFPTPFKPYDGHTAITFTNLPATSRITITTVSGKVVRQTNELGPGDWVWEVKNNEGKDLVSGVYLYCIEFKGESSRGKIMVIR
jgi:hypothetical protein